MSVSFWSKQQLKSEISREDSRASSGSVGLQSMDYDRKSVFLAENFIYCQNYRKRVILVFNSWIYVFITCMIMKFAGLFVIHSQREESHQETQTSTTFKWVVITKIFLRWLQKKIMRVIKIMDRNRLSFSKAFFVLKTDVSLKEEKVEDLLLMLEAPILFCLENPVTSTKTVYPDLPVIHSLGQ